MQSVLWLVSIDLPAPDGGGQIMWLPPRASDSDLWAEIERVTMATLLDRYVTVSIDHSGKISSNGRCHGHDGNSLILNSSGHSDQSPPFLSFSDTRSAA